MIESSRPRGQRVVGWPVLVVGVLLLILFASPDGSPVGSFVRTIAPALILGLWITLVTIGKRGSSRLAAETEAVAALDELVQLRRWPEAAELASRLFAQPMLSAERRQHGLMALATILARYHRFTDARVIHDHLLQRDIDEADRREPMPDPSTSHAIRVARAMGMLRDEHLVDADRAMSELRRDVNHARDEIRRSAGPDAASRVRSAGLVLLDLYRDVKTNHLAEVVDHFDASLAALREQLGSRVGDAWVLNAYALHCLGRDEDAVRAYANATALTPAVELHRRYPETSALAAAFTPYPWPASAA